MGFLDRVRSAFARTGAATLGQAEDLFEADRLDEVEVACAEALARDRADARALHLLGLVAGRKGDPRRSAELIAAAVAVAPDVGLYRYNLGNAQRALGDAVGALASYTRAVVLDPGRFAAWFNLAQLEAEQGRPAPAIAAFRRALAIDPSESLRAE